MLLELLLLVAEATQVRLEPSVVVAIQGQQVLLRLVLQELRATQERLAMQVSEVLVLPVQLVALEESMDQTPFRQLAVVEVLHPHQSSL